MISIRPSENDDLMNAHMDDAYEIAEGGPHRLGTLHTAGRIQLFGQHVGLSDRRAFHRHIARLRKKKWGSRG
jgi:hypothetical protein